MPDIRVFGRRAGLAAAEEAKARGPVEQTAGVAQARSRAQVLEACLQRARGVRPPELKKRVQKLMWDHVGLVRSGPKMEQTLRQLAELRTEVLPGLKATGVTRVLNREWMEAIELENMLDIAEAMTKSSLLRKETRGAHYRTDFPELDTQWTANVWVKRDGSGLSVERHPVGGAPPVETGATQRQVAAQ